jgi:hypothetical protein
LLISVERESLISADYTDYADFGEAVDWRHTW